MAHGFVSHNSAIYVVKRDIVLRWALVSNLIETVKRNYSLIDMTTTILIHLIIFRGWGFSIRVIINVWDGWLKN